MALNTQALTTLARQKDFLGISVATNDTLLTILINAVTDFVENYCDKRFRQTAYSNQLYDGNGTNKLLLRQYPVTAGETFTLEERDSADNVTSFSTVDSDEFFVKESQGIVEFARLLFKKLAQHYRITYTAGYNFDNTTPGNTLESQGIGDMEYAVWKLVAKAFSQRKSDTNVTSESLGDYSVTLRKTAMADPEIRDILNKYKRPYGD